MALDIFNQKKNSSIGKLLEDLTTLEINTIIKPGMTAAQPPDSVEELLQRLVEMYQLRMALILKANNLSNDFKLKESNSVKGLHDQLNAFQDHIKKKDIWLIDTDFIRVLRMQAFCHYIETKSKSKSLDESITLKTYGIPATTAYEVKLNKLETFRLVMSTRDRVKLQKIYDLGTENIVMQTRFSISGDVVTRIEEGFSLAPKQVILDIHNRHTDLSVNYWKSLVEIVKDIVSGIFTK
jgi:hypothetical protein